MMESDEWAEEDLPAARELVESVDGAELFLYRATSTCSPTAASPTMTSRLRGSSGSAFWRS
jgi:hypothetical protein